MLVTPICTIFYLNYILYQHFMPIPFHTLIHKLLEYSIYPPVYFFAIRSPSTAAGEGHTVLNLKLHIHFSVHPPAVWFLIWTKPSFSKTWLQICWPLLFSISLGLRNKKKKLFKTVGRLLIQALCLIPLAIGSFTQKITAFTEKHKNWKQWEINSSCDYLGDPLTLIIIVFDHFN